MYLWRERRGLFAPVDGDTLLASAGEDMTPPNRGPCGIRHLHIFKTCIKANRNSQHPPSVLSTVSRRWPHGLRNERTAWCKLFSVHSLSLDLLIHRALSCPVEQVLSDSFTIPEWDPAAISDVLERLNPRNCQVCVTTLQESRQITKGERKIPLSRPSLSIALREELSRLVCRSTDRHTTWLAPV